MWKCVDFVSLCGEEERSGDCGGDEASCVDIGEEESVGDCGGDEESIFVCVWAGDGGMIGNKDIPDVLLLLLGWCDLLFGSIEA